MLWILDGCTEGKAAAFLVQLLFFFFSLLFKWSEFRKKEKEKKEKKDEETDGSFLCFPLSLFLGGCINSCTALCFAIDLLL